MVTVLQERDYSIPSQKPGKAQPGRKVGNTTVPNPRIKPKSLEFTTQKAYGEYLRAWAKHYKAPTWAEEDIQEDSDHYQVLSSEDLDKDGVYLVRCLNTGILQALELYNDSEEGVNIHHTETMESFIANTPAPKKEPIKAAIGKQMKHTNSRKLVEEALKGKPELSFEEIVPKEY